MNAPPETSALLERIRPMKHSESIQPVPADADLLARIAKGDTAALESLFQRHRNVAFQVAYRLLGNEADALDAVQDGFLNALQNLEKFRGQSSFKTWLLRVVSNASLDLGRGRRRRESRAELMAGEGLHEAKDYRGGEVDSALERIDLRKQLDTALAELPEPQRQTFVLHAVGELSYQEVAEALGVAIGTVMSRLFYARQKLKTLLAPCVSA